MTILVLTGSAICLFFASIFLKIAIDFTRAGSQVGISAGAQNYGLKAWWSAQMTQNMAPWQATPFKQDGLSVRDVDGVPTAISETSPTRDGLF